MVILPISAITVFVSIPKGADAQAVVGSVISSTVGRVIRAIDLKVQSMQNQTIWLQNAQKTLENQLSKLKLTEISSWSSKQKDLFSEYYQELWNIKSAIAYYSKISELTEKQVALVNSYNQAWNLLKADKHFTATELTYMTQVYSGILQASVSTPTRRKCPMPNGWILSTRRQTTWILITTTCSNSIRRMKCSACNGRMTITRCLL